MGVLDSYPRTFDGVNAEMFKGIERTWEDSLRNRQDPTFTQVFAAASPRLDS